MESNIIYNYQSTAGKIVSFITDHVKLFIICAVCVLIYILLYVRYIRLFSFSNKNKFDTSVLFLNLKKKNIPTVLNNIINITNLEIKDKNILLEYFLYFDKINNYNIALLNKPANKPIIPISKPIPIQTHAPAPPSKNVVKNIIGKTIVKDVSKIGKTVVKDVSKIAKTVVKDVSKVGKTVVKDVKNVSKVAVKDVSKAGKAVVKDVKNVSKVAVKDVSKAGKVVVKDVKNVAKKGIKKVSNLLKKKKKHEKYTNYDSESESDSDYETDYDLDSDSDSDEEDIIENFEDNNKIIYEPIVWTYQDKKIDTFTAEKDLLELYLEYNLKNKKIKKSNMGNDSLLYDIYLKKESIINPLVSFHNSINHLKKDITKILSDINFLDYITIPDNDQYIQIFEDIKNNFNKIRYQEVYKNPYTILNPYSWIIIEVIFNRYITDTYTYLENRIKPLLKGVSTNDVLIYINSKNDMLIKKINNPLLIDFINKYTIFSKIYFSSYANKKQLYDIVIEKYSKCMLLGINFADIPKSQKFLENLSKNINDIKNFISSLEEINLYLNIYQPELTKQLEEQYQYAYKFFKSLLKPHFNDYFINKTYYNFLQTFNLKKYNNSYPEFKAIWNKLGIYVKKDLPKMIQNINSKKKSENFVGGDIVENFSLNPFKSIMGPINTIVSLIKMVMSTLKMIVSIANDIAKDPFNAIVKIITLILCCILYVVVFIIFEILSIDIINRSIPYLIYYTFRVILPFMLQSALYLALLVIIVIICVLLAIINKITNGRLKDMTICENNVNAWFKVSNYKKNQHQRKLACYKPCANGFLPDKETGLTCIKTDENSFCPEAAIYKIYSGDNKSLFKSNQYLYPEFNIYNSKYIKSNPSQREAMLKQYYTKKQNYLANCKKDMQPYNKLIKSICNNVDVLEKDKKYSKNDLEQMKKLCNEVYCKGDSPMFCNIQNPIKNKSIQNNKIKKIIFVLILTIILLMIMVFVIKSM